jgi:hypothetical protein
MDGAARFSLGGGVCEWYRNDMTSEFDYNLAPGTRVASDRWALPTFAVTQPPGYGWFMLPPHDRLTLTTTAAVTGGSFTLEFDGQPTTDLSFNASAGEVERALAAVIPTQTATVLCTGGPLRDASIAIILKNGVGAGALLKVGTSALTGASGVKPIVTPKTGSTDLPARIIADLFATIAQPTGSNLIARADWWNRSWLHSDGMLAALHLEGLRLALMRQPAAGARPDDEFNDLATRYSVALDDYFEVRKVSRLSNGVMARGRTDYFENASAGLDDLQVGDQVLFATNPALTALGRDAWDPLTVLVTDVDTSPDDPRSNLNKLRVQGFGTADVTLASLQLLLVKQADQALKGVQAFIPAEIDRLRTLATALGQSFTPPQKLSWDIGVISTAQDAANDLEVLCLWNPYGDTWDSPGPWWIRFDLNAQVWDGGFGSDAAKILSQFPGAILWPKAGKIQFANTKNPWRKATAPNIVDTANGFREPPWQDARHTSEPDTAIFIPLFQPFGGWESYFEVKAKSSAESWPSKLDPVVADARWIAGLATDTVMTTQVRVIRPRAKTHP